MEIKQAGRHLPGEHRKRQGGPKQRASKPKKAKKDQKGKSKARAGVNSEPIGGAHVSGPRTEAKEEASEDGAVGEDDGVLDRVLVAV